MYGKIVKMFCCFLFVLVILFTACLFAGCRTTMVPDITERTKEYRELESEIRDGENESIESALRRFKKKIQKAGVLSEVKKRERYEKPSVKRKRKSEAARKRKV